MGSSLISEVLLVQSVRWCPEWGNIFCLDRHESEISAALVLPVAVCTIWPSFLSLCAPASSHAALSLYVVSFLEVRDVNWIFVLRDCCGVLEDQPLRIDVVKCLFPLVSMGPSAATALGLSGTCANGAGTPGTDHKEFMLLKPKQSHNLDRMLLLPVLTYTEKPNSCYAIINRHLCCCCYI